MTDIFISYAREDKDFVRALHEAIEERDRDAWVDWEDIPPTAEWLEEIKSAIDASDTVVFIVSPDFISSQICRDELSYAVEQHKRLVPVLRREVDNQAVPHAILKINWVFFRENDDFDASFEYLIDAIETDLDLVRIHTRLLVRAKEWTNQGRDKSFLLRGRDLHTAEEWLDRAPAQDPRPTLLHSQYISASRKAATKRQQITLGAIAISLIAAVILAGVAFYQRHVAEEQRKVALARQLAAQAVNLSDQQPDLALLLSLEANRITHTAEMRGSLLSILEENQHIVTTVHDGGYFMKVAFSSDSRTVAYSGRRVTLFDTSTGQAFHLTKHNKSVWSVTFSPDGKKLASGSYDGTVILWDVDTRQAIGEPLGNHEATVWSVAFSPDGRLLASGSERFINLWDVATHRLIGQLATGHRQRISSLEFSPDGQTLVTGSCGKRDPTLGCTRGEIRVWDVNARRLRRAPIIAHNSEVWNLAISPDEKFMVSGGSDGSIVFWDMVTLVPVGAPLVARGGRGLAFSPDGKLMVSGGGNNVSMWNVTTRKLLGPSLQHKGVTDVAFSPDGQTLVSVGRGVVTFWDVAARNAPIRTLSGHKSMVTGVTFTPDGEILISSSVDGQIAFWNVKTSQPTGLELTGQNGLFSLASSVDGRRLATGGRAAPVVWDVAARMRLDPPLDDRARPESLAIAFSPDGGILASGGKLSQIVLWDLRTRKQLKSLHIGSSCCVWSLAFSPDGRTLVSGGEDGIVKQWDVRTGEHVDFLSSRTKLIFSVVFSPDSKILASGSSDGTIILWDVEARQPRGPPIQGYLDSVKALAFSPDGNKLIAGGGEGTILVWDVPAGQPFLPLRKLHTAGITSVAFSPDGKTIASGGEDQRIKLWSVDPASWRWQACKISNRNLSKQEWQQYLGDERYELTCPDLVPLEE